MSEPEALESFIDKWRARWPEWGVAQVFVPVDERPRALAWSSLLQELTDAAWGGADRRPGEAKLGWWMEELQGWTRGARRHPLGLVLQRQDAPWSAMTAALPGLAASRERPLDPAQAQAQLDEFAQGVAAIEQALFPLASPDPDAGRQAALSSLLHMRVAHHPADAAPLLLLAQGEEVAGTAWVGELARRAPPGRGVARPRRVLAGLALARLRRSTPTQPLPPPATLLAAWRAARG